MSLQKFLYVIRALLPLSIGLGACVPLVWMLAYGGSPASLWLGLSGSVSASVNLGIVILLTIAAFTFISWGCQPLIRMLSSKFRSEDDGEKESHIGDWGQLRNWHLPTWNKYVRAGYLKDLPIKLFWIGFLATLPWLSNYLDALLVNHVDFWSGSPLLVGSILFLVPCLVIMCNVFARAKASNDKISRYKFTDEMKRDIPELQIAHKEHIFFIKAGFAIFVLPFIVMGIVALIIQPESLVALSTQTWWAKFLPIFAVVCLVAVLFFNIVWATNSTTFWFKQGKPGIETNDNIFLRIVKCLKFVVVVLIFAPFLFIFWSVGMMYNRFELEGITEARVRNLLPQNTLASKAEPATTGDLAAARSTLGELKAVDSKEENNKKENDIFKFFGNNKSYEEIHATEISPKITEKAVELVLRGNDKCPIRTKHILSRILSITHYGIKSQKIKGKGSKKEVQKAKEAIKYFHNCPRTGCAIAASSTMTVSNSGIGYEDVLSILVRHFHSDISSMMSPSRSTEG